LLLAFLSSGAQPRQQKEHAACHFFAPTEATGGMVNCALRFFAFFFFLLLCTEEACLFGLFGIGRGTRPTLWDINVFIFLKIFLLCPVFDNSLSLPVI
jgi:hypothetical protein